MRNRIWLVITAIIAAGAPAGVAAQGAGLSVSIGAAHPGSDLYDLRDAAGSGRIAKGNALALGAALEFSMLRVGVTYATGATIRDDGIEGHEQIGEGSLLAVSGDLVLRPIPRIVSIQPYLLGGVALKRDGYSWDDDGFSDALPEDETDFAFHIGIGADLMLGRVGIMAEISDFITRDDDEFGRHDSFLMVGLRIGL